MSFKSPRRIIPADAAAAPLFVYGILCRVKQDLYTAYWGVSSNQQVAVTLKQFGANVRRLRGEKEMTQERLAELVDLNIRTIQKIEAGETNILVTTTLRIQRALGCAWEDLMPKR